MIAGVEQHILGRLQRVKQGDTSVQVYGPGPARPKGKTLYPCYALSRHLPPEVDMDRARPYLDQFLPSNKEITITIPYQPAYFELSPDGSDLVLTGPESWTVKKWPTPVKLSYQLDILATEDAHLVPLIQMLFEALPVPYSAEINDIWFTMIADGSPVNLDEIEKPLFRIAYRYIVTNVWVERLASRTVPSITRVTPEIGMLPTP